MKVIILGDALLNRSGSVCYKFHIAFRLATRFGTLDVASTEMVPLLKCVRKKMVLTFGRITQNLLTLQQNCSS